MQIKYIYECITKQRNHNRSGRSGQNEKWRSNDADKTRAASFFDLVNSFQLRAIIKPIVFLGSVSKNKCVNQKMFEWKQKKGYHFVPNYNQLSLLINTCLLLFAYLSVSKSLCAAALNHFKVIIKCGTDCANIALIKMQTAGCELKIDHTPRCTNWKSKTARNETAAKLSPPYVKSI